MTHWNKAHDFQHLILALRQRGMQNMDMKRTGENEFTMTMAYFGPHTPLLHTTLVGRTEVDVLENAREFLLENGLPL